MSDSRHLPIKDLRREYAARALDERTVDPDPLKQFRTWFEEARQAEILDANAMALATVTPEGDPAIRTVLIKDIDERGVVFFTHHNSPKGEDLARHPRAGLLFYWAPLERQVRITGSVERVPVAEAEAYFASRPRDSQIATWAARQSAEIPDRAALERRVADVQKQYEGVAVPRPPDWGGYRVVPDRFEFWQGRAARLHDRLLYTPAADGWRRVRLAP